MAPNNEVISGLWVLGFSHLLPRAVNKIPGKIETLRQQEVSLVRVIKRANMPLKTAGIDLPNLAVKSPTRRY